MPSREINLIADWVKIYRRVVSETRLLPQVLDDQMIHLPQKKVSPESYLMCSLCGVYPPKLTCNPVMQKSSYFQQSKAILGKSWLNLAIFWLLSG